MVSLEGKFKHYLFCLVLVTSFMFSGAVDGFAAIGDISINRWLCIIGQTRCCINGTQSCCEDNGTLYDTWSCSNSCLVGNKEYQYIADAPPKCSYTTKTRTCCSDGTWSGWDMACPVNKTCSSSSKPATKQSCYGGYQTRSVSCNTSTGTWQTGAWGQCDCSDPEYELVPLPGSGTCCQRKDGTGLLCARDDYGPSWRNMMACNGGPEVAVNSISACGTCTKAMADRYPSYQCCVRSTSGFGPNNTTYTGYVCSY